MVEFEYEEAPAPEGAPDDAEYFGVYGGGNIAYYKDLSGNEYCHFSNGLWLSSIGFPAAKEIKKIIRQSSPLQTQKGGNHYQDFKIQPVQFISENNIGFLEGNVIKYVCRHEKKNGLEDIEKAIHYLELIKEMRYGK